MKSFSLREHLTRWLLTFGVFLLIIYFFSPAWSSLQLQWYKPVSAYMMEVRRGAAMAYQMAHLGEPIPDPLHQVIQWRLFFPAVGHYLSLPAVGVFWFAPLGALLTIRYVIALLRRHGLDRVDSRARHEGDAGPPFPCGRGTE